MNILTYLLYRHVLYSLYSLFAYSDHIQRDRTSTVEQFTLICLTVTVYLMQRFISDCFCVLCQYVRNVCWFCYLCYLFINQPNLFLGIAGLIGWVTGWVTFLWTQFLRIYKRHEFQTLHANSMWWYVDTHVIFFLIFGIFSKNAKCIDFLYMQMLMIHRRPHFLTLHVKNK